MYADPTPKINVKIKTPTNSDNEFKMYSYKKVFLSISKYRDVSSKKLKETVKIGIMTKNEINTELKNHKFNLFENILKTNIFFIFFLRGI